MAKMSYAEKLRDPRWQRKRLEALESANWECDHCEESQKTLSVHHKFYVNGREPWDYSIRQLEVLCDDCHREAGDFQRNALSLFAFLSRQEMEHLTGCAKYFIAAQGGNGMRLESPEEVDAVASLGSYSSNAHAPLFNRLISKGGDFDKDHLIECLRWWHSYYMKPQCLAIIEDKNE